MAPPPPTEQGSIFASFREENSKKKKKDFLYKVMREKNHQSGVKVKNVRLPPSLITAAAFVSLLEADKRNTATQTALCAESTGGRAAEALPLTVRLFLKRGGQGFYFFICRGRGGLLSADLREPLVSLQRHNGSLDRSQRQS